MGLSQKKDNGRYVTVYGNDVIMCEFEAFGRCPRGMSQELIPIKIATAKLKDLKLFLFELANGCNQSYNRNKKDHLNCRK